MSETRERDATTVVEATRAPPRPAFVSSLARWMAVLPINAVLLSLCMPLSLVSSTAAHWLLVGLCRIDFRLLGLEVSRDDPNGAYPGRGLVVVCLNQASLIETLIAPCACPRAFRSVVNLEFTLIPFYGWVQALCGRVIVRQWPAQAKRQLRRAARDLRRGACYYISIEGRRSLDGALQPYKKGPVVMAIEGNADILPVIFEGARDRLPHGHWRVRPGPMRVRRLPLISTDGLGYDDRDRVVDQLRALAEQHLRSRTRGCRPRHARARGD